MSGKLRIRPGHLRARWRGRSRFKRMIYGTAWRGEQRRNWRRLRFLLLLFAAMAIPALLAAVL